jgi:hypothetical protein
MKQFSHVNLNTIGHAMFYVVGITMSGLSALGVGVLLGSMLPF